MTNALSARVIDPPVTSEERLADAMAAFDLACDLAIESLDRHRFEMAAHTESLA